MYDSFLFTDKEFPEYTSTVRPTDYDVSTSDIQDKNISVRYSFKISNRKQDISTENSKNPDVFVVYIVVGIAVAVVILLVSIVYIFFKRKTKDDYRLIRFTTN